MHEPSGPISVVVPVYGDGCALDDLAARLERVLDPIARWELIVVNDGSPAPVWDRICHLATAHNGIKAIDLQHNAGQHTALLAGIGISAGDVVVTMDDDLQHPPEAIPALLRRLDDTRVDVVYGTPVDAPHGWPRQLGGTIARWMVSLLSGVPEARVVSAFRAFRGTFRAAFAAHEGPRVFIDGVLCRGPGTVTAVPVRHDPRRLGHSGYELSRLVSVAVDMATAFGISPVRVACLLVAGGAAVAAGFVQLRFAAHPTLSIVVSSAAFILGGMSLAAGFVSLVLYTQSGARGRSRGYTVRSSINLEQPLTGPRVSRDRLNHAEATSSNHL